MHISYLFNCFLTSFNHCQVSVPNESFTYINYSIFFYTRHAISVCQKNGKAKNQMCILCAFIPGKQEKCGPDHILQFGENITKQTHRHLFVPTCVK